MGRETRSLDFRDAARKGACFKHNNPSTNNHLPGAPSALGRGLHTPPTSGGRSAPRALPAPPGHIPADFTVSLTRLHARGPGRPSPGWTPAAKFHPTPPTKAPTRTRVGHAPTHVPRPLAAPRLTTADTSPFAGPSPAAAPPHHSLQGRPTRFATPPSRAQAPPPLWMQVREAAPPCPSPPTPLPTPQVTDTMPGFLLHFQGPGTSCSADNVCLPDPWAQSRC